MSTIVITCNSLIHIIARKFEENTLHNNSVDEISLDIKWLLSEMLIIMFDDKAPKFQRKYIYIYFTSIYHHKVP